MNATSLKARNITVVIGFLCIIISCIQIYSSFLFIQGESRNRFENDVISSIDSISSVFESYEKILYSVKSFYESSDHFEANEFNGFISPILDRYKEISSIAWAPIVKGDERGAFLEHMNVHGYFSDIREKDSTGEMVTNKELNEYYPITYIYPTSGNEKILGYNLGSDKNHFDALNLALKYNVQTSTNIIQSDIDKNNKIVMLFTPVYEKAESQGVITGILELSKLFSIYGDKPFTLSISETQNGKSVYKTGENFDENSILSFQESIKFANKDWYITARPNTGEYINDYTYVYKLLIVPISVFISFLYLVYLQNKIRNRNQEINNTKKIIEGQFSELFDNSLNEIFIFDAKTLKFTIVNEKARTNIGYSMEELKEMYPYDIKPEYTTDEFLEMAGPLLSGETDYLEFNTKHERKDGTLYDAEIRLQMYNYNERRVFLAIILDVTEKQNFLTELKVTAENAEKANRAKSEFLANMSHELRTPLNSLLILANDLAGNDEGNLNEEEVESAQIIYNGGKDLLRLINDILDLSKVESGKVEMHMEEVNVKDFVNHINDNFSCVAKDKNLSFDINMDYSVSEIIRTDVGKVEQILRNFLSNAFKFTHEGGVTVNIGRPAAGVEFNSRNLKSDKVISFEIIDTGIGISEENQKEIFKAFQQADGSTSRKYGGTGLGLAITKNYTELLGGEIQLKSELDKGSKFILYLPEEIVMRKKLENIENPIIDEEGEFFIEDEELEETTTAKDILEEELEDIEEKDNIVDDRNNIGELDNVILVIEDDLSFANILRREVNKQGAKCVITTNGEKGIEFVSKYMPDAIISDIELPGINGTEVFRYINNNKNISHIPIYFISIHDDAGYVLDQGAIGYLTKPVSKNQLHNALKQIKALTFSSSKEILIIEDNDSVSETFEKKLIDEGFIVKIAKNAEDGLDILRDEKIKALILSLNLPGMSGIDMLKAISEDTNIDQPAVVIYSERNINKNEEELISKYANTFICQKNDEPEAILREIMGPAVSYKSVKEYNINDNRADELEENNVKTKYYSNSDSTKDMEVSQQDIMEGKSVLLVDDDVRNIFALSKILKKQMRMKVFIAENGEKALEVLEEEKGKIDIVLMDIMMPVMNGYEATKKIRESENFSNLPVIAVTAKTMKSDREKCLKVGASEYLAKPIDVGELSILMEKLIKDSENNGNIAIGSNI